MRHPSLASVLIAILILALAPSVVAAEPGADGGLIRRRRPPAHSAGANAGLRGRGRAMVILVLGKGLDELVDFAITVVEVGAGTQAPATNRDHDAVFLLQMPLDLLVVVDVGDERHDAARLRGVA